MSLVLSRQQPFVAKYANKTVRDEPLSIIEFIKDSGVCILRQIVTLGQGLSPIMIDGSLIKLFILYRSG